MRAVQLSRRRPGTGKSRNEKVKRGNGGAGGGEQACSVKENHTLALRRLNERYRRRRKKGI